MYENNNLILKSGEAGYEYDSPWSKDPNILNNVETISFTDEVIFPQDCNGLFANLPKLNAITGLNNIDTSRVVNMRSMFANSKITSLDLFAWDTRNVNYMSYMFFSSCVYLN